MTYSANGSYRYKGFSVGIGVSYVNGVTRTILADPSRYSRLGLWGDFKFQYNKYIETRYGVPTGKVSYGVSKTLLDKYVDVKYQ